MTTNHWVAVFLGVVFTVVGGGPIAIGTAPLEGAKSVGASPLTARHMSHGMMAQKKGGKPRKFKRIPIARMTLEVQRVADHWKGDIHVAADWVNRMSTAKPRRLTFRIKRTQRTAPAQLRYHVYAGGLTLRNGKPARPVRTGNIGPPPRKGHQKTFDIDFTKIFSRQPNRKTYYVRLTGRNAKGTSTGTASTVVAITYNKAGSWGQKFSAPTLEKLIGSKDARGKPLTKQHTPMATVGQRFQIVGRHLRAGDTTVRFIKHGKVIRAVTVGPKDIKTYRNKRAVISAWTPTSYALGMYYIQLKTPWGLTAKKRLYIMGNAPVHVKQWSLVNGGVYENHTWTEEAQGIATDGKYWYISSNNDGARAIYKFTIKMKLVKRINLEGYGKHIGGLDYYKNHLYVAVEEPNKLLVIPTHFKGKPQQYRLRGKTVADPSPLKQFPWCAINPITGFLYTSNFKTPNFDGTSRRTPIQIFRRLSNKHYVHVGAVVMQKHVSRIQGGDISPNGKLILASDASGNRAGFYVFDVFSGQYHGRVPVKIDHSSLVAEEIEGLTISPPNTATVKGKKVNVHLVVLDNDKPDNDDVFFKHLSVPSLSDLFGF